MILIMENWRKFLNEEEGPKIDQAAMDAAMGSMKGMLSGKGPKLSPKRAKIQQRLEKIGMSKSEAVKFIEFKGMGGDAELEKNVAGLEKYAQTPLNKWPQQGKLSPGDPFELTTNQRSWKGQVGDPKAPAWIQNRIPGWTTKNPIYPATPEELGFDGMRLLNRKLRAAAGKVPQAAAQQKQAPAAAAAQQKQAPAAAQQKQEAPSRQNQEKIKQLQRRMKIFQSRGDERAAQRTQRQINRLKGTPLSAAEKAKRAEFIKKNPELAKGLDAIGDTSQKLAQGSPKQAAPKPAPEPENRGPTGSLPGGYGRRGFRAPEEGMPTLGDRVAPAGQKSDQPAATQGAENAPAPDQQAPQAGPFRRAPDVPAYEKKYKNKPVADFSKDEKIMSQRGKRRKFNAAYRKARKAGIKYFHVPGLKYKIYAVK